MLCLREHPAQLLLLLPLLLGALLQHRGLPAALQLQRQAAARLVLAAAAAVPVSRAFTAAAVLLPPAGAVLAPAAPAQPHNINSSSSRLQV